MKARTFLIAIIASFLLVSCIDMTEELFLHKKGNGKYVITLDLSGVMDLANLSEMLGEELPEDSSEEGEKEGFLEEAGITTMDTIISFADYKDSLAQEVANPEILEKGYMHLQMNEEEKTALLSIIVKFDQLSDINAFFKVLSEADNKEEKQEIGGMGGMGGMLSSNVFGDRALYTLSKRVLTRMTPPQQQQKDDLLGGEDMEFAKMMFQDASYTTIYHLPGRVKSTTIPNAKVDGKTITVENKFLDIIEQKASMDGHIKFRRR